MDDIYIKDCGWYLTVKNLNGDYSNHCHVDNKKAANTLKKQIDRKNVPKSKYFRSCAMRVTIDDDYIDKIEKKIKKDKQKLRYVNVPKK